MKQTTLKINRPRYEAIREVNLNGIRIGQIIRWVDGSLAYLSWRNGEHYFIKYHGFGVDRSLLMDLISKDKVNLIVIEYKKADGNLKYFVSKIDDWVMKGELYEKQIVLSDKYMDNYEVR